MKSSYDWNNIDEYNAGVTNRMTETVNELEEYMKVCDENGIDLIMFINPYCKEQYEVDLDNGYLEFLGKVARIHSFINFAGINEYTTDYNMFIDPTHYSAYLGDKILDVIANEGGEKATGTWGMYVDSENVDEFIRMMKKDE